MTQHDGEPGVGGANDGGDPFFDPSPLPDQIVEIAAKYAIYGKKVDKGSAVADIRTLLSYIEYLEWKCDRKETT